MNLEWINFFKKENWELELYQNDYPDSQLQELIKQYPYLDESYIKFLKSVKLCSHEKKNIMFNCLPEFMDQSVYAFKWNEFEIISMDAAEGDEEWQSDIRDFWRMHLPIILSVGDGYAYYAAASDGKIVYGFEPEFEESKAVADSFEDFMKKIISEEIVL